MVKKSTKEYFANHRNERRSKGLCTNHKGHKTPCVACRDYMRDWRARQNGAQKSALYERKRAYWLDSKFKISLEQWNSAMQRQGGRCAICRSENRGDRRVRRLCVDHNHQTSVFRGLLCHSCNKAIGLLNDDPALCEAAASYLRVRADRVRFSVSEGR
jgi:hypothetical protein